MKERKKLPPVIHHKLAIINYHDGLEYTQGLAEFIRITLERAGLVEAH